MVMVDDKSFQVFSRNARGCSDGLVLRDMKCGVIGALFILSFAEETGGAGWFIVSSRVVSCRIGFECDVGKSLGLMLFE
jgi:hypothetical protein